MYGKALRLSKMMDPESHRTCIVPMDHGVTLGCVRGLTDYVDTIRLVMQGGANAIVLHKGLLERISRYQDLCRMEYFLHLSVSTTLGVHQKRKILASSVEEALKLGANGVSVHINLGGEYETEMLRDLGTVSKTCMDYGLPLLAMMYMDTEDASCPVLLHLARIAEELGADMVKIPCPQSRKDMKTIAASISIPIIIAGGSHRKEPENLLEMVDSAIKAGMDGIAIGRNIFQSDLPLQMTGMLCNLIHGRMPLHECLQIRQHDLTKLYIEQPVSEGTTNYKPLF